MGTLNKDQHPFMIISHLILLRKMNFLDKLVEKTKTHVSKSIICFPKNRTVYDRMWENTVHPDRTQTTIWRMRIVC
jgi:hypothetical protein